MHPSQKEAEDITSKARGAEKLNSIFFQNTKKYLEHDERLLGHVENPGHTCLLFCWPHTLQVGAPTSSAAYFARMVPQTGRDSSSQTGI